MPFLLFGPSSQGWAFNVCRREGKAADFLQYLFLFSDMCQNVWNFCMIGSIHKKIFCETLLFLNNQEIPVPFFLVPFHKSTKLIFLVIPILNWDANEKQD